MTTQNKLQLLALTLSSTLLIAVFAGCQHASTPPSALGTGAANPALPALLSAADAKTDAPPAKGRAQIWAETCNRCHNTRSPDSYSGKEWAIVMTHMRVRGYLTGEDQRAILEFLQSQ
jgi:hypothetical protein